MRFLATGLLRRVIRSGKQVEAHFRMNLDLQESAPAASPAPAEQRLRPQLQSSKVRQPLHISTT